MMKAAESGASRKIARAVPGVSSIPVQPMRPNAPAIEKIIVRKEAAQALIDLVNM